jgi:hypothetical protein
MIPVRGEGVIGRSSLRTVLCGAAVLIGLSPFMSPPATAEEGDRLPYHLTVEVAYGKPLGPMRMRDTLARELVRELDARRCFEAVSPLDENEETGAGLRLTVILDRWRDETEHEMSMAQKNDPQPDPDRARLTVESVEAFVYMELAILPDGAAVRQKQYRQSNAYRPLFQEDARMAVEDEMLFDIVRNVKNFACKGNDKKLRKQIEQSKTR